jgi:hypothetical protein
MHLTDEQKRELVKAAVVTKARDLIAHKEEIAATRAAAQTIFQALRDAPTWQIVYAEKPEDFTEPEEIWSQPVEIVTRADD